MSYVMPRGTPVARRPYLPGWPPWPVASATSSSSITGVACRVLNRTAPCPAIAGDAHKRKSRAAPTLRLRTSRSMLIRFNFRSMTTAGPQAASAPDGQTLEIQRGHAPGHQVGDDPRGSACHRPAHVAVPAVEEEVPVAAEPKNRRPVRCHRAQARAVLAPVVVRGLREEIAREFQDVVEVARRPAPVVAGELRGRRQPQPIAQA